MTSATSTMVAAAAKTAVTAGAGRTGRRGRRPFLADTGVTVARASEVVRPGLLDPAAARHLHEPQGSPVLVSSRITYTLDATPVVSDHATILGSMMEIRTERAATGLSLTWGATS